MRIWILVGCLCLAFAGCGGVAWGVDNPCTQPDKPKGDCPLEATDDCGWNCMSDADHVCCFYTVNGEDHCDELEVDKGYCCIGCTGNSDCKTAKGADGGSGGGGGNGPLPLGSRSMGETNVWGGTVVFRINLGNMIGSQRPAGHLYVRVPGPVIDAATPSCLSLISDSKADVDAVVLGKKIQRVYAPQAGVLVVVNNAYEYELRFYEAGVLESVGDGVPAVDPFTVWRIFDPDGGTNGYKRLTFLQLTDGQTNNLVEYEWTTSNSMAWHTGGGLREDQVSWSYSAVSGSTNRTDVHLILNPDDTVAERTVRTYRHYVFGDVLIQEQKGAEGEEITTSEIDYYDDVEHPGRYGKISQKIDEDGAWIRYDYDLEGRKVSEVSTWLDGTSNAPDNESVMTMWNYSCVDSRETPRLNDRRWRTKIDLIAGHWVSTSYRAYFHDGSDQVLIEEEAATGNSPYGDEANRRTIRREYGPGADVLLRSKPLSVTHPDGTVDTWEYHFGTYSVTNPSIGVFTEQAGGSFVEVTETLQATQQTPFKSIRTISVWDAFGREVQIETWVCTGSNQYERMDWQTITQDTFGRELVRRYANGLTTETTWGCCGKESEIKPDGQAWTYVLDMLGRTTHSIKEDGPTEFTVYDAAGKVLSKTLSGGGLSLTASNRYDLAGRLVKSWDEAGLSTSIEYGERAETVILPGEATEITVRLRDGKVKSYTGTGKISMFYEYGMENDGGQWTKSYTGATNSPAWRFEVWDIDGRTVRTERPGFGGTVITNAYDYDTNGRLIRERKTGSPDILYMHNERGELLRSGTDVNTNGVLDLASMDRIQEQQTESIFADPKWLHQQAAIIYPFDNSSVQYSNAISRSQVGGSGCACESGQLEIVDARGNITSIQTSVEPLLKQITKTMTRPGVGNAETTVTINGLLQSRTLPTGAEWRYIYDGLDRQIGIVEPRTGTNRVVFLSNGRVDYTEDAAGNRTTFGYDSSTGRRTSVTDAQTNAVYTQYDLQGRVTNIYGAAYPVAYVYDEYGHISEMMTWRDTNSAPDATYWYFEEATGLLTNKVYADGTGIVFDYNAAGRLTKRTWARGIETEYAYDAIGQLTNINYSDSTPDVSFYYNRMGRQNVITDATGTRGFAYSSYLQLQEETNALGTINRIYDEYGRPQLIDLGEFDVRYDYDDYGRLVSITSTVNGIYTHYTQHRYSYLEESTMLASISNGGLITTYNYESHRDLQTEIGHQWETNQIDSFVCFYDPLGRPIERVDSDSTTNRYGYNQHSELVSVVMGTNNNTYAYDFIGNRLVLTNNGGATIYMANELNLYTNIVPAPGSLTYDMDANMVSAGEWSYSWDAENRLVTIAPVTTNADSVRLNFTYDYMNRCVQKEVETYDGSVWSNTLTVHNVYDGWNLICEDRSDNSMNNYYVWGLGLSGSLQKSGSAGGLLARVRDESIFQPLYYGYNANGDVTDILDKDGNAVAHYKYDKHGVLIYKSGIEADINPFRYEAKYCDTETEYVHFPDGVYVPILARLLSRTPMYYPTLLGEYNIMGSNPINAFLITHSVNYDISARAFDGGGYAVCSLSGGRMFPVNNNETCTKDCTSQHEQQHIDDQSGCCKKAQDAFRQAKDGYARGMIQWEWMNWVKDSAGVDRPYFGCRAYGKSVECAEKIRKDKKCDCPDGPHGPKQEDKECCDDSKTYLDKAKDAKKKACDDPSSKNAPSCPDFTKYL